MYTFHEYFICTVRRAETLIHAWFSWCSQLHSISLSDVFLSQVAFTSMFSSTCLSRMGWGKLNGMNEMKMKKMWVVCSFWFLDLLVVWKRLWKCFGVCHGWWGLAMAVVGGHAVVGEREVLRVFVVVWWLWLVVVVWERFSADRGSAVLCGWWFEEAVVVVFAVFASEFVYNSPPGVVLFVCVGVSRVEFAM